MNMPTASAAHLTTLPAGTYALDPALTTVTFATRHMFGTGKVEGTFKLRHAEFTVGTPVAESRVHAVLDAASFDTATPKRDDHVRSPKFLDSVANPDITFTSDSLAKHGATWIASGTVTANRVSAPVELVVDHFDDTGAHLKFSASASIDRYAHGITAGKGLAGRRLVIRVDAVVTR